MIAYFFASLIIVAICLAGMAVGVIFSNKPLKGSCGGLGRVMGNKCMFCENKSKCTKQPQS